MQIYYVVKYTGQFGYIKPWAAVRDIETFSQQFLTPSIIEGMRIKLEVSGILRHRLSYLGMNSQQEQVQASGTSIGKTSNPIASKRMPIGSQSVMVNSSILHRNVLIEPHLHLAFPSYEDAEKAHKQHICLCRNEDVLLPSGNILEMSAQDFDTQISGFELRFEPQHPLAFSVGYSRFPLENPPQEAMKGWLQIVGNPIRQEN
jgi:hypothetical protein